jgi:molybdopterin synthase sulfur carrier subunit
VKLVYFAWVRERIGRSSEEISLPAEVATAGDLIAWLRARGPEYEHALAEPRAIRIAVERLHAKPETPLAGASEVALFPPMSGG